MLINDGLFLDKFPKWFKTLVSTGEVQRLRKVRQLGSVPAVYPNATHTRYSHSIGTAGQTLKLWRMLVDKAREDKIDLGDEGNLERTVVTAGLTHDLGHPAGSHVYERQYRIVLGSTHEDISAQLILGELSYISAIERMPPGVMSDLEKKALIEVLKTDPSISSAIAEINVNKKIDLKHAIANIVRGIKDGKNKFQVEIVSGIAGTDRMDYLPRDAIAAGIKETTFNPEYLQHRMRIVEFEDALYLAIEEEGISNLRDMMTARRKMHTQVYTYEKVLIYEALRVEGVKRALLSAEDDVQRYKDSILLMDDEQFERFIAVYNKDPVALRLIKIADYSPRNWYKIAWGSSANKGTTEDDNQFIEKIGQLEGRFPEDTARDAIVERANAGMSDKLENHEVIVYVRDGARPKTRGQQLQKFDLVVIGQDGKPYRARDRVGKSLFDGNITEAFEEMIKPALSHRLMVVTPEQYIPRVARAAEEYKQELLK